MIPHLFMLLIKYISYAYGVSFAFTADVSSKLNSSFEVVKSLGCMMKSSKKVGSSESPRHALWS